MFSRIELDEENKKGVENIDKHVKLYGSDEKGVKGTHDEECEREKERETEEVEKEVQHDQRKARAETELDLTKNLPFDLKYICKYFSSFNWDDNIQMTENFIKSIDYRIWDSFKQDEYIKFINFILIYPKDGKIVLISNREAEYILKENIKKDFIMIHYVYLKEHLETFSKKFYYNNDLKFEISTKLTVQLKLFNGETSFKSIEEKEILKLMFQSKDSTDNAKSIVISRGNSHHLESSDLESVCEMYTLENLKYNSKK